jgi:hypothetical protein
MLGSPSFRLFVSLATVCLGFASTPAGDSELSREDIPKITAVCRSLLGVEDWRPKEIFARELLPYTRSKNALAESSQVECSFRCGGTLLLRGGGDIRYGYSNQPIGATHRIDTIAFHIHGKRIVAVGPGIDYYPYPYAQPRSGNASNPYVRCQE